MPPSTPPPFTWGHTKTKSDALGCIIEYNVERFDPRNFKAQVTLNKLRAGLKVLLDFGPTPVNVAGSWGASNVHLRNTNAHIFVLSSRPDENGGFSFNGRGVFPKGAPIPNLQCISDPPPPPPPRPPAPPPPPKPPPPPSPSPSPPPPPPPPVSIYAPKRIEHVRVSSSTCASIPVQWHAAEAATGYPVLGYEVSIQRADASSHQAITNDDVRSTSYELTGLIPATRYHVRVRARSSVGYGPTSDVLTVTTAAASRAPMTPFGAAKAQPLSTHECTTIELHLPELRGGCGGDERLLVEMSDGGAWLPAVEGVKAKTAKVTSLDPYVAYLFRMSAVNSAGSSPSGPESAPLLTDNEHARERAKIGEAPNATAVSSASVVVSWARSPCRPQLTFELLYARQSSSGPSEWQTIAKGISGSTYEARSLRCPTGCIFRIRPIELRNLADPYSKPSASVRTKQLKRAPTGAVRLELKLSVAPSAEEAVGGLASQLTTDLATALAVSESRVDIVEVRCQGLFFIFDLLPGGTPTPTELVAELARHTGNPQSQLFAGVITRGIDPSAPPLLVANNGSVSSLTQDVGVLSGLAGTITSIIAVCACLVAAVAMCLRAVGGGSSSATREGDPSRRSGRKRIDARKTYGQVGDEGDEYDFDDDELDPAGEARRHAGRR